MSGFVFGVLSSLVATALTVAGGWLGARRAKHWPIALLGRLTGLGVIRRYSEQRMAATDLASDLEHASSVSIMTGRGNELSRETFEGLWNGTNRRVKEIKVLLPDPDAGADSWLGAREMEMAAFDPGVTPGSLVRQIRTNVDYVAVLAAKDQKLLLRLCDFPFLSRVVIADQVAYVTTYVSGRHGRNSPCIVLRGPSPLYDFAVRIFTTAWDRGHAVPTQPTAPVP